MILYKLRQAFRNLTRNGFYSIINIIGLSLSIACCILIIFFIKYQLSYDRFHKNADRIYRFTYSVSAKTGYKAHFARCSTPWIKHIPDDFPEVEKMVTLMPYRNITLLAKDQKFSLLNSFYADSTFFNVFSIKLLKGDSNKVLSEPNVVVISKSLAQKYFGNSDPVGQTIANTGWHDGKKWTKLYYTITGVFEDLPANSHFHSDLFISKSTMHWNTDSDWKYVYLLFNENSKPTDFLKKFPAFLKKYQNEENDSKILVPHLQLITNIHLLSNKDREIEENGNMMIIYIMGLVGLIILIISWINYLNLGIATIYNRSKSLNIYKIHGSPNRSIIVQYFIESFIVIFISFDIAYVLISIFFPLLKTISGNVLNDSMFHLSSGAYPWLLIMFVGSLFVGCIPIITYIFKSKKSLSLSKSAIGETKRKPSTFFRKTMIVFQFTLTIMLIISALTISSQGKYILSRQAGAKQDSVLVIKLFNQDILAKYSLLKSEILKSPYIKEATATFENPFGETMDAMGFETNGIKEENKDKILWVYAADDNYFKFLEVPIIAGRNFPTFNENLKREFYILNESAVKELGWTPEEAIGKPFKLKFMWGENIIYGGEIVGVVKDFNINTLHHEIKPFVFFQKEIWFWNLLVKIDMTHKTQAMEHLKKKWDEISPDYPFTYEYNTDMFFQAYKKEVVQSRLTVFFSFLAIIISCLGLFAISSIIILQRTKEIGIRKVNGAETKEIMIYLLKDFAIWVALSIIIACPIAYFAMNKWLENFVYKIGLEWWIFIFAGLVALFVAILTVGWQSWKAANRNPVEALRYE